MERLSINVGSTEIILETGRIAKQAQGAVMVTCGETMVLSAICVATELREGQDFFPLTVDYREKSFAAGRIPGNFFRREGRPSEREVLVCRLTDRPLRPLFPKGFYNEVQVFSTVFSTDNENNPDVLSIIGASASLHISKVPFEGPIGAVRIGLIDGELVVNPPMSAMIDSELDLVIAGTKDAITMVEGAAKQLSEDKMLEALEFGHGYIKQICDGIEEFRKRVGAPKMTFEAPKQDETIVSDVDSVAAGKLKALLAPQQKQERAEGLAALKKEVLDDLKNKYGEEVYIEREAMIGGVFGSLEKKLMREQVLADGVRLDGRDTKTIRPITIEVGILPRVHGSCLFTRGETQAIVTCTLGTSRDEQRTDELSGEEFKRFMLHYNFPSWSVGEVRRISGPGRREIGHGKLAERAVESIVPVDGDDSPFPYTIRIVSDITESNGSSSMASACGATLALMDAGVPIKAPVAGIAMGMIKEGDRVAVLSDILGAEDHLGDMDFKVCGTANGITAFQMDCKVMGVPREVMKQALYQARDGRIHILGKMEECLSQSRSEISQYAPRIISISIPVDKIREVIGPGGKVIREIQRITGAEIEIQDDGSVNVAAVDSEQANAAIDMIRSITAEPEVGEIYSGKVTRIMPFGAFVAVLGGKEGLVHISELAVGRVNEVTDVVDVGDEVNVKVIEIDKLGRVNLSKVEADREKGLISDEEWAQRRPREERGGGGDRGGDRGGRGGDRGGRGGDRGGRGGGGGRGGDRGGRGGGRDRY
ncbi:MAG: polyribonucleotide nucleotidyltransferase [Candidatus Hydrogenedentes bacterium]|nr:polyribonucleotide nucleotidyltransferase [Candidatus Hydrogenedentota bacterium]